MVAIARVDLPHRSPLTCWKPSRHRSEAGAELIEFAFVLPLLLLVVVGIFDFGFLFQRYEVVTNAAREGARAGVLPDYDGNATAVTNRVLQYLTSAGLEDPTPLGGGIDVRFGCVPPVPPAAPPCVPPSIHSTQVTVTYPHRYLFLGPIATLFGGRFSSVTLQARSTMRSEAQ